MRIYMGRCRIGSHARPEGVRRRQDEPDEPGEPDEPDEPGEPDEPDEPSRAGPGRAEPSRSNGQCVRYSNLPGGYTQKRASRVRETHTFKKLHFPASVSSTRDAHFQNQVSSRLRETLFF